MTTTELPIIGIDTNSYGLHVVSTVPVLMPGAEECADLDAARQLGWVQSGAKDPLDRRKIVYPVVRDFFAQLPPGSVVFAEEPLVLTKNPETTRKLVMMGGLIEAAVYQSRNNIVFHWVAVSTWRKTVLAPPKGMSPRKSDEWKALAKLWVASNGWAQENWPNLELETIYESQPDLYDAHCICEYGRQIVELGLVKHP